MQPSFQIRSSEKDAIHYTACSLLIDAGERHFCFALYSRDSNEFVALEYYQFKAIQKQEQLRELLSSNTLLQLDYPAIYVYYNSASGLLVPERFYDEDSSSRMLELVAGDMHMNMPMSDEIEGLSMRNVYQVPEYLRELMVSHFPNAAYEHIHTGILRQQTLHDRRSDRIEVIFYPELIILSAWKNDRLQIIQCFYYETPQDVTYHLLNTARQCQMPPAETRVIISGLVEISSDLFAATDHYFQFVETAERPEQFNYDPAFDGYPAHFFSPMFSLGLCVS